MVARLVCTIAMAALTGLALAQEPPPAAAPAAPEPRSFVIFFTHAGGWIPQEAESVLPQIAEVYLRVGYGRIAIDCYSDNVGTQDLNIALTSDRAARIKTELVRYNVPDAVITPTGHGFADPLVPGAAPDVAVSNRRCSIALS